MKKLSRIFKKLTKKIIFVLSAFVVAGAGIFVYSYFFSKSASAAWFNESWAYRTPLTITHNASVSNQKVKFDIDTATLITNGKMQSDCGDSRFTDISGKLLRYYLDSSGGACNTASTDYYVLIPTINNGTTVIYHYYGNPTALNGTEAANFSEATLTPSTGISAGTEAQGPGPVAYWKLDDGQGTTAQDSTSSNLDGTLNNTPTWQTENMCIAGKCLYFDGTNNENVSKSDDAMLDFAAADNFTVSAWVKRNGASSANNFILTKAAAGYTGYKLYQDASGDYCFDVSDGTNTDTACTSAVEFDDDKWHLVQGVKSGTASITLYVDGNQRAQDASIAATGTLANSGSLYVGVDLDGTSNEWLGFIDDVKVYNFARSAAQILQDYNSGLANAGTKQGTSAVLGAQTEKWLSDGLVGYWKMDEAAANSCSGGVNDSCDSSGNGQDGAWNGNTANTTGKFGNGTSYDGTGDYVAVGTNVSALESTTFTLSAWINPTTSTSDKVIFYNGDLTSTRTGWGLVIEQSNDGTNPNKLYIETAADGTPVTIYGNAVTYGSWQHVVVTFDASTTTAKIYQNGALVTTNSSATVPTFTGDNFVRIGSIQRSSDNDNFAFFNGSLDETRIYNRALSPKEISDLYNWAPGPVGYWNFDERTGTSTYDTSGGGNTGTITNATWNTGKFGSGLSFDGNGDFVNIPQTTTLDTPTGTISMWAYFSDLTDNGYLWSQNSDEWSIYNNGSQLKGYYDGTAVITYTPTFTTNQWVHLSFTFVKGSTCYLYVNGVQATSGTCSSTAPTLSNTHIGSISSSGSYAFNGKIDDVRVYNYQRTAKQVVSDMGGGSPSTSSGRSGGPIGYWKFDEGTDNTCSGGTNDACNSGSQGSTLDGAQSGMAVPATSTSGWTQSGKFGKALIFDGGNDYINTGYQKASGSGDGSISLWFKTSSQTSDAASSLRPLVMQGGGGDVSPWGIHISMLRQGDANYGKLNAMWGGTSGQITSSDTYLDNLWHHVVLVKNDTNMYLYVDGVLAKTGTAGSTWSTATNLQIGGSTTDTVRKFTGAIDEVKVYNYALTADEVKLDYNRGSSLVLGSLSDNSSYQVNAANQEYCIPGDSTSCVAPIGRWDFEERTGTSAFDESGNGLTGTLGGDGSGTDLPSWTTGKVGAGLSFDGSDDHVLVSDNDNLSFTNKTMTINTWIKGNVVSGDNGIVVKRAASNFEYGFYVSDSKLSFNIWTAASASVCSTAGSATLSTNTWYFVTAVADGTNCYLYLNGVRDGTAGAISGTVTNGTAGVYIGYDNSGVARYFNGKIDQVRVFNYARSAAQIAWDYNRGKPVGHWKFDECQGTTANDSSGNSETGTITIGGSGTQDAAGTCTTSDTGDAWYNGRTGKRNYSLNFDGTDDFVNLGQVLPTAVTTPFTFAAWVNPASAGASSWRTIIGTHTSFAEIAINSSNQFTCGQNGGGGFFDSVSTVTITNGAWYHVTCTYDGSNIRVYINGKQEKLGTSRTFTNASHGVSLLGRYQTAGGEWMNGQIDDAKIYNYALTAAQVKDVMNDGAVRFGPSTGSP